MPVPFVLEVCVDSVVSAVAAEKGGAQRVELCSGLAEGGFTPSGGLIAMTRKRVAIPLHVLIRPRAGDFFYTRDEFEVMKRDITLAKQLGANGVVFGILAVDLRVDVPRTKQLVELARPLKVTFHRAFDEMADLLTALEDVISTGADRILTSGGVPTAKEGVNVIASLVAASQGRVTVMACGTIRERNVRRIIDSTGVNEVHANLQSLVSHPTVSAYQSTTSLAGALPRLEVVPDAVARFLAAAAKARSAPDQGA
jgi:copper homeostasis protein